MVMYLRILIIGVTSVAVLSAGAGLDTPLFFWQNESRTRLAESKQNPEDGTPRIAQSESVLAAILKSQKYLRLKLDRTPFGYRCVSAKVGNREISLILDTGAPQTLLDRERAKPFKLEWSKLRDETKPARSVLLGPPTRWSCELPTIQVGPLRADKFQVFDTDMREVNRVLKEVGHSPVDGLLGADLLDQGEALIDYRSNELYLRVQE